MIAINVVGQPRIEAVFSALNKALDTTEILDESAAALLARIRARFLDQVSPDGVAWKPSEAAMNRAKFGRGGGTLFKTGRLFHSIQLAHSTQSERFIGTDVPYGIYHNYGWGQEHREFMGFSDGDISLVQQLIIHRIQETINGLPG